MNWNEFKYKGNQHNTTLFPQTEIWFHSLISNCKWYAEIKTWTKQSDWSVRCFSLSTSYIEVKSFYEHWGIMKCFFVWVNQKKCGKYERNLDFNGIWLHCSCSSRFHIVNVWMFDIRLYDNLSVFIFCNVRRLRVHFMHKLLLVLKSSGQMKPVCFISCFAFHADADSFHFISFHSKTVKIYCDCVTESIDSTGEI